MNILVVCDREFFIPPKYIQYCKCIPYLHGYVVFKWNILGSVVKYGDVEGVAALCAGILEQSIWARNRVGIGLSYRSARLHRLAESIPGLLKGLKYSLQPRPPLSARGSCTGIWRRRERFSFHLRYFSMDIGSSGNGRWEKCIYSDLWKSCEPYCVIELVCSYTTK